MECTWVIATDDFHSIQLTYELFNISYSEGCDDGFVEVAYRYRLPYTVLNSSIVLSVYIIATVYREFR